MTWVDPRTWLAGEKLTAAKLNELRDALKAIGDPWTSYTPVWTGTSTNPVLNNGTLTGAGMNAGGLCIGRIRLVIGSTTTFGTGFSNFTLPFTLASGAQWEAVGTCSVRDASPSVGYAMGAFSASSTRDLSRDLGRRTPRTDGADHLRHRRHRQLRLRVRGGLTWGLMRRTARSSSRRRVLRRREGRRGRDKDVNQRPVLRGRHPADAGGEARTPRLHPGVPRHLGVWVRCRIGLASGYVIPQLLK